MSGRKGDGPDDAVRRNHRHAAVDPFFGPACDAEHVAVRRGADRHHRGDERAHGPLLVGVLEKPAQAVVLRLGLGQGSGLALLAEQALAQPQVLLPHRAEGDIAVPGVLADIHRLDDELLDRRGHGDDGAVEDVQP